MTSPATLAAMEAAAEIRQALLPPEDRLWTETRPGQDTLALNVVKGQPAELTIVRHKDAQGGTVRFELTVNRRYDTFNFDQPAYYREATVPVIFQEWATTAQQTQAQIITSRRTAQNGNNQRQAITRASRMIRDMTRELFSAAHAAALKRAIKQFAGAELYAIARQLWGDHAGIHGLNAILILGPDNVAQALKQAPNTARLAVDRPAQYNMHLLPEGPKSPQEIIRLGQRKLAQMTGEEGLQDTLERLHPGITRRDPLPPRYLAEIIEAQRRLPFRIEPRLALAVYHQIVIPETNSRRPNRIAALIAAAEQTAAQPHDAASIAAALKNIHHRINYDPETTPDTIPGQLRRQTGLEKPRPQAPAAKPRRRPAAKTPAIDRKPENTEQEIRTAIGRVQCMNLIRQDEHSAALTAGPEGPELYRISRRPDGAIEINPRGALDLRVKTDGRITQGEKPRLPHLNAAAFALARILDPDRSANTDSAESDAAVQQAARLLERHQAAGRLNRLIADRITAAARLADRCTAQLAMEIADGGSDPHYPLSIAQYNAVAAAPGPLTELARTNPGAAAWILHVHPRDITGRFKHPGQLITLARRNHRLTSKAVWRNIAQASAHAISTLLTGAEAQHRRPPRTELALQAAETAAAAGTGPLTDEQALALDYISNSPILLRPDQHRPGRRRLADYILREPAAARRIPLDQLWSVADYCRAGNPTAVTLNGLLKASRRWHHSIHHRTVADYAARHQPVIWETALTHADLPDGIKAIALNSSQELAAEAVAMSHCIHTYDQQCLAGDRAVFRLSTGATVLLTLDEATWRPAETRRYRNAVASPQDHTAARDLADLYTSAWSTWRKNR